MYLSHGIDLILNILCLQGNGKPQANFQKQSFPKISSKNTIFIYISPSYMHFSLYLSYMNYPMSKNLYVFLPEQTMMLKITHSHPEYTNDVINTEKLGKQSYVLRNI